jgi:membrane protein YdbS with pleckstrin-like domain
MNADAKSQSLRLRPPRYQVSPRAIAWWTTQAALEIATVLIPLVIALGVWVDARPWLLPSTAALALIALAYLLVMPRWRFRVHRWETTDDAVYTSRGWLNQEWRVAPLSRIQTVDTERGPLQQLFGLATVTVTTASAAGALQVAGLDRTVADELVARLTETTQATPGDAT